MHEENDVTLSVQNTDVSKSGVDLVVSTQPDVIEVYAEAVFEHSASQSLTQDELESLGRFTTSLEHLQRNVRHIVIDQHSSH